MTAPALVLHASHVRVELDCPAWCAAALGAVYAPARRPLVPARTVTRWEGRLEAGGYAFFVDGAPVSAGPGDAVTLTGVLETHFITQLTAWHPDACLLHAALVELDGAWILLAGDSGRGKSSLCLEVTRRGGRYFTDELVVTDSRHVWAVGRTPVFDFGPADAPLPPWLEGADRESYRYARPDGQAWARPLFAVPEAQWAREPVPVADLAVVALLGRGEDSVVPRTAGEALATLLDASLTREWRQLGPLAAGRRSFGISWASPAVAIDRLRDATRPLAGRPSGSDR